MPDLNAVVQRTWLRAAATILQFALPAALVTGAAASFVKGRQARATFDRVSGQEEGALARLSWSDFETLIGEGFDGQDILYPAVPNRALTVELISS